MSIPPHNSDASWDMSWMNITNPGDDSIRDANAAEHNWFGLGDNWRRPFITSEAFYKGEPGAYGTLAKECVQMSE